MAKAKAKAKITTNAQNIREDAEKLLEDAIQCLEEAINDPEVSAHVEMHRARCFEMKKDLCKLQARIVLEELRDGDCAGAQYLLYRAERAIDTVLSMLR